MTPRAEVHPLCALVATYLDLGNHDEALRLAEAALDVARAMKEQRVEAIALHALGSARHRMGEHAAAIALHRQAAGRAGPIGDRFCEVQALIGEADACRRLARYDPALDRAERALRIARTAGFTIHEGSALTVLGGVRLDTGEATLAAEHATAASAIQRRTGHRLGEARALTVLADALDRTAGPETARPHRLRAQHLYAGVG